MACLARECTGHSDAVRLQRFRIFLHHQCQRTFYNNDKKTALGKFIGEQLLENKCSKKKLLELRFLEIAIYRKLIDWK